MVDQNNQSNSDDPLRSEKDSKEEPKKAGQVVDELKKLLAGLGQASAEPGPEGTSPISTDQPEPILPDITPDAGEPKIDSLESSFFTDPVPAPPDPIPEPTPEPPPPPPEPQTQPEMPPQMAPEPEPPIEPTPEPPVQGPPDAVLMPEPGPAPEPIGTPDPAPDSTPAPEAASGSESDSDFWKGNVLGWPTEEKEEKEEEPLPPESSPFQSAGGAPIGTPETKEHGPEPKPAKDDEEITSLGDTFPMSPGPALSSEENVLGDSSSLFESEENLGDIFKEPEPPKVAASEEAESLMPPPEELAIPKETPPPPPPEPVTPVTPQAPQAAKPEATEEMAIPIPGTIENKEESAPQGSQNWEADDVKPEGLCQISCFFPTGKEDDAKKFVEQLKSSGSRAPKPVTVQSVFVQGWEKGAIDIPGWEKAAELSGSEFTFVLVSRKDQELFGDWVSKGRRGSWKGRIVFIEQIQMKSLYADLIIQLGRLA